MYITVRIFPLQVKNIPNDEGFLQVVRELGVDANTWQ